MPTRLANILTRVRDTLSDPERERWTNARLLRLADEAHQLIAARTNMLQLTATLALTSGKTLLTLPADVNKVTRILNEQDRVLPVYSHAQADKVLGVNWQLRVGSPAQAIIFDKSKPNELIIFPVPDLPPANPIQVATLNSLYGVTVAGGLQSRFDLLASPYGVVTGVTTFTSGEITLYYTKIPATLVNTTDLLETSPVYDTAIKFYIAGMALRDDKDSQNRALGAEELQFFNLELNEARKNSSMSFVAHESQYDTPYVGGV